MSKNSWESVGQVLIILFIIFLFAAMCRKEYCSMGFCTIPIEIKK